MTSQDVTLMKAAYNQGLIPEPWLQTGTIAATVANCSMARDPKAKPLKPDDFIPRTRPKPTPDELMASFEARRKAHHGGNR